MTRVKCASWQGATRAGTPTAIHRRRSGCHSRRKHLRLAGSHSNEVKQRVLTALERLERHIEPEPNSGCWLWIGSRHKDGYGWVRRDGRSQLAHRYIFQLVVGPIPTAMNW